MEIEKQTDNYDLGKIKIRIRQLLNTYENIYNLHLYLFCIYLQQTFLVNI